MNIISFEKAYSLHPYETFEKRRALICGNLDARTNAARQKYIDWGWMMFPCSYTPFMSFRKGIRYIGDVQTWSVRLSLDRVKLPDSPVSDDLSTHTWFLDCDPDPSHMMDTPICHMRFKIFSSPVLKYNYVFFDPCLFKFIYPLLYRAELRQRVQSRGNTSNSPSP